MKRREFVQKLGLAGGAVVFHNNLLFAPALAAKQQKRPNIVWIMLEDWCPDLSCYGTKGVHTPHIDALAGSSRN